MSESMRSKGMRDMLPAEMERFRRIEKAFRDVCLGWGYQEVRTPTLEHLYLFTSAGTLSPQMLDRVYSFLDWDGWSGERVVLRPDSTIPTVRLFVENMADATDAKLFYVQNVLRFDPGDDSREDWQCGVELLGDSYPRGDVELILMAREVLDRMGIAVDITLSHPGIVRSILDKAGLDHAEQLAVYGRVLEGDLAPFTEIENKLPGSASVRSLLATEGEGPRVPREPRHCPRRRHSGCRHCGDRTARHLRDAGGHGPRAPDRAAGRPQLRVLHRPGVQPDVRWPARGWRRPLRRARGPGRRRERPGVRLRARDRGADRTASG